MKSKEAGSIPQETNEESRREFLIKSGKMALYIPPAMMVLMHPSRKALACSPRPPRCGPRPGSGGPKFGGPKFGGPKFG